jgi:hypothetical protein
MFLDPRGRLLPTVNFNLKKKSFTNKRLSAEKGEEDLTLN